MSYKIGIDIGGTKIKAAVVENNLKILYKVKKKTNLPKTADEILDDILDLIKDLLEKTNLKLDKIENIGMGSPGIVDIKTKKIEYSCNFNWYGEDLANKLAKKIKKEVYIDNDANAAALGEYLYGEFDNVSCMIFITLGTGIGGGIILDKKIYRGFNFSGGEIGHMVIKKGGRECSCGQKGCFEKYASKTGVLTTTLEIIKRYKDSILWSVEERNGKLTGKTAFRAAKLGDKAALKVVKKFVSDLAVGVSNLVNIFQPEVLVIGGGLSKEGDMYIDKLQKLVEKRDYAKSLKKRCKILIAKAGNNAGLIGAANLSRFLK